jgi:hypothetical protein
VAGAALVALLGLAGAAGLVWRGRAPTLEPARGATSATATSTAASSSRGAAPLLRADTRLACPPLEASDPADIWLGAAVASAVCRRAGLALGDPLTRALAPADLLDLPRVPTSGSVPYDDASARGRALARAREHGMVWLDGRVARRDGALHASFTLRDGGDAGDAGDAGGLALASWSSSGSIVEIERHSIDTLRRQGQLPGNLPMHPELARWYLLPDARAALAHRDVVQARADGRRTQEACVSLREALPKGASLLHELVCSATPANVALGSLPLEHLPAVLAVQSPPEAEARALAETLTRAGARASSPYARARLARGEALAWLAARDNARALDAALRATGAAPFHRDGFMTLYWATFTRAETARLGAHFASWHPDDAVAWERVAFSREYGSPTNVMALERAATLVPHNVSAVTDVAVLLAAAGRHDEARGWAARLLGHDDGRRTAGEIIVAIATASEGRFDDAARQVVELLGKLPALGRYEHQDFYLAGFTYYLAELLGRSSELGASFHRRFVLTEPPKVLTGRAEAAWWTLSSALSLCLMAERATAAACVRRLQALEGAAPLVASQTDARAVALAMQLSGGPRADEARRLIGGVADTLTVVQMPFLSHLPGDDEVSVRIDEAEMRLAGWFHGATMAHVRQARRAFTRGEHARARALATTVVRAWSTVDHPPAATDEMRALLRRLPSP